MTATETEAADPAEEAAAEAEAQAHAQAQAQQQAAAEAAQAKAARTTPTTIPTQNGVYVAITADNLQTVGAYFLANNKLDPKNQNTNLKRYSSGCWQ